VRKKRRPCGTLGGQFSLLDKKGGEGRARALNNGFFLWVGGGCRSSILQFLHLRGGRGKTPKKRKKDFGKPRKYRRPVARKPPPEPLLVRKRKTVEVRQLLRGSCFRKKRRKESLRKDRVWVLKRVLSRMGPSGTLWDRQAQVKRMRSGKGEKHYGLGKTSTFSRGELEGDRRKEEGSEKTRAVGDVKEADPEGGK